MATGECSVDITIYYSISANSPQSADKMECEDEALRTVGRALPFAGS